MSKFLYTNIIKKAKQNMYGIYVERLLSIPYLT